MLEDRRKGFTRSGAAKTVRRKRFLLRFAKILTRWLNPCEKKRH